MSTTSRLPQAPRGPSPMIPNPLSHAERTEAISAVRHRLLTFAADGAPYDLDLPEVSAAVRSLVHRSEMSRPPDLVLETGEQIWDRVQRDILPEQRAYLLSMRSDEISVRASLAVVLFLSLITDFTTPDRLSRDAHDRLRAIERKLYDAIESFEAERRRRLLPERLRDVQELGWRILERVPVGRRPWPRVTYSFGHALHDRPEIAIVGEPQAMSTDMFLAAVGGHLRRGGDRLTAGLNEINPLPDVTMVVLLQPAPEALADYLSDEIQAPVLQLLWPDDDGYLPGNPAADPAVVQAQIFQRGGRTP